MNSAEGGGETIHPMTSCGVGLLVTSTYNYEGERVERGAEGIQGMEGKLKGRELDGLKGQS